MPVYRVDADEEGAIYCTWHYTGVVEADTREEAAAKARTAIVHGDFGIAFDTTLGDRIDEGQDDVLIQRIQPADWLDYWAD